MGAIITVAVTMLLLFGLAGLVRGQHRVLRVFVVPYWAFSWIGQSFALPLALVCGLLLITLAASGSGRPRAEAVCLVALLLYIFLHIRNHRMGKMLLHTVAASAGTDGSTKDPAAMLSAPFLTGLLPLRVRRPGVERLTDIAYGEHGLRNLLDIYRPAVRPQRLMPILIQVHGGAWVIGNKEQQALPLIYHLASRGWMCVAINYRLAPQSRFPVMLTDVLRAVAWVKRHAGEFGGDASFVALTGGSAGGHLSALAALVPNRPALQPGFESEDTVVNAVMPLYGRYDFLDAAGVLGPAAAQLTEFLAGKVMPGPFDAHPEAWNLASPVSQVHRNAPPFLVVHGTHDSLIAVEECRYFVERLRRISSSEVVYAELRGAQHAFDLLTTPLTLCLVEAAELFLWRHYASSTGGHR